MWFRSLSCGIVKVLDDLLNGSDRHCLLPGARMKTQQMRQDEEAFKMDHREEPSREIQS